MASELTLSSAAAAAILRSEEIRSRADLRAYLAIHSTLYAAVIEVTAEAVGLNFECLTCAACQATLPAYAAGVLRVREMFVCAPCWGAALPR